MNSNTDNTDDTDLHGSGSYVSFAWLLTALEPVSHFSMRIKFCSQGLRAILHMLFFNRCVRL